jgi:hypothetical protein
MLMLRVRFVPQDLHGVAGLTFSDKKVDTAGKEAHHTADSGVSSMHRVWDSRVPPEGAVSEGTAD